jgi:hypothetical protein
MGGRLKGYGVGEDTNPVILQMQVRRGFGYSICLLFQTQWEPLL